MLYRGWLVGPFLSRLTYTLDPFYNAQGLAVFPWYLIGVSLIYCYIPVCPCIYRDRV